MRVNDLLNDRVRGNIRAEMARRSVSQRKLARALGISQSSLNRLLGGHQLLRVADVEHIASVLMVDPDRLLCESAPSRRRAS